VRFYQICQEKLVIEGFISLSRKLITEDFSSSSINLVMSFEIMNKYEKFRGFRHEVSKQANIVFYRYFNIVVLFDPHCV